MTTETATSASDALRDLAEEFWQGTMRADPTFATILGDRRFDDLLPDISPAGLAAERERLRDVRGRAQAIDREGLQAVERTTIDVLIEEVGGQLAFAETGEEAWKVDPLNGAPTAFMDLPDFQPVETPEQAGAMVRRWRAIGAFMDQYSVNLRGGLAGGAVAARDVVRRELQIVDRILEQAVDAWSPMAVARLDRPGWSAEHRERFAVDLRDALERVVRPSLVAFRALVAEQLLPAARPQERPGIMHVPGGLDAYHRLIRAHTTLDLEAEEIHQIGRTEMERIDREFAELGRRVLGTADRESTLVRLKTDPALRFSTSDEVFQTAQRSLERAQAAIPGWFGRTCKALCEVIPIPDHAAEHQTLAYYSWPAMDGSRPGRFWINLYAPETRPRYDAEALAFHEAVPGHHLQLAIAQELEGLPTFQRNLGSTAFAEGWGLYTERLSDEMGLYSSDLDRLGILSFDAWRAGRLVVDTGMHAMGWSRAQAIEYLREHTALGDNNIEKEVDRYIAWPAQALAYKIGQLEILKLRSEAKAALDGRFDIRAFHDVVLGAGAIPLATLRERVENWIAAQRAA